MLVGGSLNITAGGNVNVKGKNFTFKGEKAQFDLSDEVVFNTKNFKVSTSESIDMVASTTTKLGATEELKLIAGEAATIKMAGGQIDLN